MYYLYLYALIMYDIGENLEASSTLNMLVEQGDISLMNLRGRENIIAFLRQRTEDMRIDMGLVENRLRLWLRMRGLFTDGNDEKTFASLRRIMHELGYGSKMPALCREVNQVEQLRLQAEAGQIDQEVYRETLRRLIGHGSLADS